MSAALSALLSALLIGLVRAYRALLAPLVGGRCRFEPSCSRYAEESIRHHGPVVGAWRTLVRLGKCHPFHPGGYDPPVRES